MLIMVGEAELVRFFLKFLFTHSITKNFTGF